MGLTERLGQTPQSDGYCSRCVQAANRSSCITAAARIVLAKSSKTSSILLLSPKRAFRNDLSDFIHGLLPRPLSLAGKPQFILCEVLTREAPVAPCLGLQKILLPVAERTADADPLGRPPTRMTVNDCEHLVLAVHGQAHPHQSPLIGQVLRVLPFDLGGTQRLRR